ncbi:MAG TPA: pirin family protein [Thermoanaerobaculia bacterium]
MTQDLVAAEECAALSGESHALERYPSRETSLGSLQIWRALPVREKRLVGPWCFLDRYGPLSFTSERAMDVAPHPHIGLQTVSWLLDGEVLHQDSLGCEALLRPGGVNVMTSGRGIAHAETTPAQNSGSLNGLQLWIALTDRNRDTEPAFQHLPSVPKLELDGCIASVFSGSLAGTEAPTTTFSPLVGADLEVHRGKNAAAPLDPRFEHALFLLDGDCAIEDQTLERNTLYYLGTGRTEIALKSSTGARILLLGGPPFPETILMWWNFVARTPEEITAAREDWQQHRRFDSVRGFDGPRIEAPSTLRFARPNPAS